MNQSTRSLQKSPLPPRLLLNFVHVFPFGDVWISAVIEAIRAGTDVPWRVAALASLVTLSFLVFHFLFSWLLIGRAIYNQGITALLQEPIVLYSLATVISGALIVFLFYIPGLALYYFSNIAFFVALPTIVTLATRQLGHRRITGRLVLSFGIAIITVSSLKSYYLASALSFVPAPRQQSYFIESLLRVRDRSPINVALKPDPSRLQDNPVVPCDAQPFVFPAVSERPWIDVIPARDDCCYWHYGYAQYGIMDAQPAVTMKARLLPDMTVRHWPPEARDVDSKLR